MELNLRVVSIEKFGNRYVVVSKDERPKNSNEMLGADAARGLLGAIGKQTDEGHVVSICGNTTIFSTNKDQMKVLDQLDKGSIIKVRGTVDGVSVGGSKGILNGLGSIGNFFNSDKDDIASCLTIDKAILISSGGGEKSWLGVFKEEFNGASTSNSPENYSIDPKQVTFIQKPEGQEVDPEVAQSVCEKAAGVIQLKSVTFKGKEVSLGENITVISSSDKRIEFSFSGNKNKQKSEFIILNKTKDKVELVLSDRDVNCLYTFNRAM